MKNNTVNFWIKQIIITFIYLILLISSYLFISSKISHILVGVLTTMFVWIMNITFAKDYQTENDIKLEEFKAIQIKELETHKSKLSNYNRVTKLQFELEFKIYKEVYAQFVNLIIEMGAISESLNLKNEELDKYIESFKKHKQNIDIIILQNSPFINSKVLIALDDTCIVLYKYLAAIHSKDPVSLLKEYKLFQNKLSSTSDSIRERIETMKIIEV